MAGHQEIAFWSTEKVEQWLREQKFSEDIIESFIGRINAEMQSASFLYLTDQDMDGEAIIQCFSSGCGPDCLRDVIPTLGKRIKVYTAIKKQLEVISYNIYFST